jgi:hypothetical protein
MSLLSWFSRKSQTQGSAESSSLGHMDATRPLAPSRNGQGRVEPPRVDNAANRKNERLERRELLYSVVRESMVRAGVLSASYKFKVLSLDQRGRQFLVMMDLSRELGSESSRWSEIEVLIAQAAKARYDILVTAVYWRTSDHVVVGNPQKRPALAPVPPAQAARQPGLAGARFEPIEAEEVAAFKKALNAAGTTAAAAAAGETVRTGPRNTPLTGYEDTEMPEQEPDAPTPGLSTTQYGDLK